jgi:hypothetical protein
VILGALGLVTLAVAGAWWRSPSPETSNGTPRLVLDREAVDLGFFPFEAPARAVFTLTNAGDGPLRLADVPRVSVLKGC